LDLSERWIDENVDGSGGGENLYPYKWLMKISDAYVAI